ncbi:MAG: hypothetical protein AABY15_00800, partial [Nanoarchaeota archaeon]
MQNSSKTVIFTDATCDGWQRTKGFANGLLSLVVVNGDKVDKYLFKKRIKDKWLRQFINRFEYEAIKKAKKMYPEAQVFSDSKIAVGWALRKSRFSSV